ncbi:ATP-binding protein [Blastococcus sp. CT_GayMR19]|uniref:ATP-dependent nuclease n=1 Tax=Blastococcus sp. CT_GayMR19 TaxID=2559608 RepID=UPI0010742916|nr:ATP-binding protein [Blastococcus sp. CT_GayMR19]TFV69010.1 ATP-binding protein [Blastococcus sp. CT_GayMR19]
MENYRSIRRAQKLGLEDLTVLVGPNNEGKSNIMRAMVMGMRVLRRESLAVSRRVVIRRVQGHVAYSYERDCPIDLQQLKKKTTLEFDFRLTDPEQRDFFALTGVRLQTGLRVALTFDEKNEVEFKVRKQGPAGTTLTAQRGAIAKFIADRLRLEYVSAIRTAQAAQRVVLDMVEERLDELSDSQAYRAAVARVQELERPVLNDLATEVERTLRDFLPQVKSVSVALAPNEGRASRRDVIVTVDDGHPTLLDAKGDGVQSLAALALLRQAAERDPGQLILAIEEPEAHLHPSAIHQLGRVLRQISARGQVIITTHHPILVSRGASASNIVVEGSVARKARSVADLRKTLGVRTSDNLTNAELVLIVEGESDARIIGALAGTQNEVLKSALEEGFLAIQQTRGASNLSYVLQSSKEALAQQHVLLDDDVAGRESYSKALGAQLIEASDVNFMRAPGKGESELEDLLVVDVYRAAVEQLLGIQLSGNKWRSNKKWSDRLEAVLLAAGRPHDKKVLVAAKTLVADAICTAPAGSVMVTAQSVFDNLLQSLEQKLADLNYKH